MDKSTHLVSKETLTRALRQIRNQRVAFIGSSVNTGSHISLKFAKPRRSGTPSAIYVWCDWRLDSARGPLASSDSPWAEAAKQLKGIVGQRLLKARVASPANDLVLYFGTLTLVVFCDHVGATATYDNNWDLVVNDRAFSAVPSGNIELEINQPPQIDRC